MRRLERLERLVRVRRAERDRARLERAASEREAGAARERSRDARQRHAAELRVQAARAGEGARGIWWQAAARGIASSVARVQDARTTLQRAESADLHALERLLRADQRHQGIERLCERLRRERRRHAERVQQRELDDVPAGGGQRLLTLLGLGIALVVAPPLSANAQAQEAAAPSDHGVTRLLEEIRTRQGRLELREREIEDRERSVDELEKNVLARLAELEQVAGAIEKRIADWEEAHEAKSISRLAKIYGTMDARRAAPLLERLELDLATRIIAKMKHKQSAALLPLMSQQRALAMSRSVAHPLGGKTRSGGKQR